MVRIKGTVILDTIRAVKDREGEDEYARILGLLEESTRRLLQGKLFPGGWYPLDAFVHFLAVDIRETASGNDAILIRRSELVVEKQLRGIYRVFTRLASTESVLRRLASIHRTYFQGVEIQLQSTGRGQALVKYIGFGPEHRLMEYVLVGFYRKTLELSGAKLVNASFLTSARGRGDWELTLGWH